MSLFDYKGKEWFNTGTGCLAISLVFFGQLFASLTDPVWSWSQSLMYFSGFAVLGLALISKKVLPSILSIVPTVFMAIFSMIKYSGFSFYSLTTQNEVMLSGFAFLSLAVFLLSLADIIFDFTDIKVVHNYPIIASFVFMSFWVAMRLYSSLQSIVIDWSYISIHVLLLPFLVVGILAMFQEVAPKMKIADEELLNNIGFLFATLVTLTILILLSVNKIPLQLF